MPSNIMADLWFLQIFDVFYVGSNISDTKKVDRVLVQEKERDLKQSMHT